MSTLGSTLAGATVLLALLSSTSPVAAQGSGTDPRGVYVGSYVCSQRQMSARLTIESAQSTALQGVFSFYAPGGDPAHPLGTFRMHGRFNPAARSLQLRPGAWVTRPGVYTAIPLDGSLDGTGRITGTIRSPGCSTFELTRDEEASRRLVAASTARAQDIASAPGFFQARTDPERCQALAKWYSRFRSEYVQTDADYSRLPANIFQERLVNLFDDDVFVPVFGKPYDQMSPAERQPVVAPLRGCSHSLGNNADSSQYGTLSLAFVRNNPGRFSASDVTSMLAYRRTLRQQLPRLQQELQSPSTSLERATAIKNTELKNYEVLWPSEYARLAEVTNTAVAGRADTSIDTWVASIIKTEGVAGLRAAASGLDQIATARTASSRPMQPIGTPVPGRPPVPASRNADPPLALASPEALSKAEAVLRARSGDLVKDLVAQERTHLAALGTGLPGLQAGTAWYRMFQATFGPYRNDPAVADALAALAAARKPQLATQATALLARINQAPTASELTNVMSTYLGVPSDRSDPGAQRVFATADTRQVALKAAADKADAEARSVTNFCKNVPTTKRSGSMEPSAHDMCLAIADRFDAANDWLRQKKMACTSGAARNSPVLALECIQLCGGTRGTCDLSYRLTQFQKIGVCEKATGQQGYVCDYHIGISANNAQLEKMLVDMLDAGETTQSRFVQTDNGWLRMPK